MTRTRFAASLVTLLAIAVAPGAMAVSDPHIEGLRFKVIEFFHAEAFAAIENEYVALRQTGQRTINGSFVADEYIPFEGITSCRDAAIADACAKSRDSKLAKWRRAFPSSQIPVIAVARVHMETAYLADRNAKSRSLAEPNFLKAEKILAAIPARERDPHFYLTFLDIAIFKGWGSKRFAELLKEATTRFPDHHWVYRHAALYYHPDLGGSDNAIEELANMAVNNTQVEYGMSMYAHVYDELALGAGGMGVRIWSRTKVDWPKFRQGLRDIQQRYPSAANLHRIGQYACLAQDFPTLDAVLTQSKSKPDYSRYPDQGWEDGERVRCTSLLEKQPAERRQRKV